MVGVSAVDENNEHPPLLVTQQRKSVVKPADKQPVMFVTIPEFARRSTLCRATIYNMIERGDLMRPVRLSMNRVAFRAADVDRWFAEKLSA